MTQYKVYLAGPISGLTFDDALGWRQGAVEFLASRGVQGLCPLRGKSYLRALGELSPECATEGNAGVLSLPRSIMTRDYNDATRCDVVLVNFLDSRRVSIGTVMEIAWAFHARIPVVCAMEAENVHRHAMVNEALGYCVPTLEEALAITCSVLGV